MLKKEKRILWFLNHETLMEFEVPLLQRLGYEIYVPKRIPQTEEMLSCFVDKRHDKSLTIPADVLERLNRHNFYTKKMPQEVEDILNSYFSAAIFAHAPFLFEELVDKFTGKLFLRSFGLSKELSYSWFLTSEHYSLHFAKKLFHIQDRFFFAQSYPFLAEVEQGVLQKKAVTLPLGLPDSFLSEANRWIGGNNKLLFVCPRINDSLYYKNIYVDFKKHFSDISHCIAGKQLQDIKDSSVCGSLPRKKYEELLKSSEVMFYHSQEPRHLHYHPLEAVVLGLPLIYMKGGMLDRLCKKELPGSCNTYEEARKKVQKILKKDELFIRDIVQSQQCLLETFQKEYCENIWKKDFCSLIEEKHPVQIRKKNKKITVLLPVAYRGGSLRGAKNIAKMLYWGSRLSKEPADIVFSCVSGVYDTQVVFSDLKELGITVVETTWNKIGRESLKFMSRFTGAAGALPEPEYYLPTDGMNNFSDSDFWLVISDRTNPPLAPLVPYGMVVYDYIQRYVPELFGGWLERNFFVTVRNASFVITTTAQTQNDAIQYAGVEAKKVLLMPMEFHPPTIPSFSLPTHKKKYFLWVTNISVHKNHMRALDALEYFYKELGGDLDVLIVGASTLMFLNTSEGNPYYKELALRIEKSPFLKKRCRVLGEVGDAEYVNTVRHAQFLWHPTLVDNGTFAVVEAAYLQVPSVSSDYSAMRYMDERFRLNLLFADPYNSRDMAEKLKIMQEQVEIRKKQLPPSSQLEKFTAKELAQDFWNQIRSLI